MLETLACVFVPSKSCDHCWSKDSETQTSWRWMWNVWVARWEVVFWVVRFVQLTIYTVANGPWQRRPAIPEQGHECFFLVCVWWAADKVSRLPSWTSVEAHVQLARKQSCNKTLGTMLLKRTDVQVIYTVLLCWSFSQQSKKRNSWTATCISSLIHFFCVLVLMVTLSILADLNFTSPVTRCLKIQLESFSVIMVCTQLSHKLFNVPRVLIVHIWAG